MHCPLLSYYTRITLLKVIFSVFGHLVPLASRIVKILLARGTTCVYRRLLDLSPCIVLFLEYFDTLHYTRITLQLKFFSVL